MEAKGGPLIHRKDSKKPNSHHKSSSMTTITGKINVVGSCWVLYYKIDIECRMSTRNMAPSRHHRQTNVNKIGIS